MKVGDRAPAFVKSGKCANILGRYVKAEIKANTNFDPKEVSVPPLPKVELKPVDIFEPKDWTKEEEIFTKLKVTAKKEVLAVSFKSNTDAVMAAFLELNYSGVPETNCIKSLDFFEPSSPFDLSCVK